MDFEQAAAAHPFEASTLGQTKTFEGPDDGDQRGMGRGGRHVVRVLAF